MCSSTHKSHSSDLLQDPPPPPPPQSSPCSRTLFISQSFDPLRRSETAPATAPHARRRRSSRHAARADAGRLGGWGQAAVQGLALTFPVAYEEVMAAAGADAPARREAGAGELGGKLDLRDTGLRKDARAIAPGCERPFCSVFSRANFPLNPDNAVFSRVNFPLNPDSAVFSRANFPLIQIMPKSPNAPPHRADAGAAGGAGAGARRAGGTRARTSTTSSTPARCSRRCHVHFPRSVQSGRKCKS